MDAEGRLFVVGRDDDMIVSGGENVYPVEVEKAIGELEAIREVVAMQEEIGLEVEILGAPATVIDAEAQRVDVVYRVRAAAGSATVAPASPEIAEVAWFCRSDLPYLQPEAVQALAALAALGDDE